MSLVKGENSYVTLNEADSYFDNRMDVAAWASASSDLKEKALITATSLIDELEFRGSVVSETQAFAFPRSGTYYDRSRGLSTTFSSTYTFTDGLDETENSLGRDIKLLRKTVYELAYHLVNNDGLLDRTGSFQDIKVGPIELKEVQTASVFPYVIKNNLRPILVNADHYWRTW